MKLDGLRVLDLSMFLPGPHLTMMMADHGAEVIKIEPPAGEPVRNVGYKTDDGVSVWFRNTHRGKKSVVLDLKSDAGHRSFLKLAETAFALKPRHEETQDILLKLQAGKEDWAGARKTLNAKMKHGSLPRDVHKRRDAVLALSEAKDVLAEGNSIETREAAVAAYRLSPDLIPAVVMAAHSYIEQGKLRFATRILKKAWGTQPHPDLAAAFAAIAPDESPDTRIKRFAPLIKQNPDHPESRMLLAELNIAAEDFPAARRALGDLAETAPDARSITIMATIERGEGASDAVVRGWLVRALSVPRGPQWVCDNCQHIHGAWVPTCENCQGFDTLSWTVPPVSEIASPSGLEMLPLIVGALDEKEEDSPTDHSSDTFDIDASDSASADDPIEAVAEEIKK